MLAHIRAWSSSPIAKIIVALIILAFVLIAYAGSLVFRGSGATETVATVGDQVLQRQYLEASTRQLVSQYAQIPGSEIKTMADFEQRDPTKQVLNNFVENAMWPEQADAMGIEASEADVRDAIVKDPRFQRQDGSFNEALYQTFALNNNPEAYAAQLASQVIGRKIRGLPLAEDFLLPAGWSKPIATYLSEKRGAVGFVMPDTLAGDIAVSDEALQTYLADNQDAFMWPELRSADVIAFTAEDTYQRYDVEESRVVALFERRKDAASRPETRVIEQISVESMELAQGFVERLRAGEQWPAIAFEATQAAPVSLGDVTADTLDPALAEVAFAAAEPGILDAVASGEGAAILRVISITPAVDPTLESMRAELEKELKIEVAKRGLFDLSQELDFKLGDGLSLADAAKALDLPLASLAAIDRFGRDKSGARMGGNPGSAAVLQAIFNAKLDDESIVITDEALSYVVDLTKIEAPAPKSFDEARADLAVAYVEAERIKALDAQAEALQTRITDGGLTMEQAAQEVGAELLVQEAATRDAYLSAASFFRSRSQEVFAADGAGTLIRDTAQNQVAVIQITAVEAGNPEAPSQAAAQTLELLSNSWQTDLADAYKQAVRDNGGYRIINRVVNDAREAVAIELGLQ